MIDTHLLSSDARDLRSYAEEITVVAKTVGTLASALKNGAIWSCWWD